MATTARDASGRGLYTAEFKREQLDTVIGAERLGLPPITTPAYSPQSNGMAEAFVHTLKRTT